MQVNVFWFQEHDKFFISLNKSFSHLQRKSQYQNMISFFSLIWETKVKLFLAVAVKNDFNMHMPFFTETVLLLLHVHMNYPDTRFFSLLKIRVSFFSFSLTKFILTVCTHTQIFLRFLILIIQMVSGFFVSFFKRINSF